MVHGILHMCGLDDSNETEQTEMRIMEDHFLQFAARDFHIE